MKKLPLLLTVLLTMTVPVFAASESSFNPISLVMPLVGIIICFLVGLLYRNIIIARYNKEGSPRPYPFQEKSTLNLTHNQDIFIREYTTRVRVSSNNNNHHHSGHRPRGGHHRGPRGGRR